MASPLAARFFTEGSAQCCAQAWLYRVQVLGHFGAQWGTLLRDGFDAGMQGTAPKGSWAQAAREQIDQEQRAVTVPAVLRLLDTLPALPPRGRFIDLGGGPGHVAIALAQRLPGWHGTVCDEPETADVARDNIRAAGLGDRLHARGCNLDRDAIGTGHDLIWCSSVLHFLRDPRAAVARMFEALNPGGLLLLAHAERADDAALSARVMPFYAAMVLRGKRLPAPGEVARWMADAGFADIRALGSIDFPMAPVWLHAGRRP
jgi:SAM-dependent methyltransferase